MVILLGACAGRAPQTAGEARTSQGSPVPAPGSAILGTPNWSILPGGQQVTLEQARAGVDFTVLVADDPLANSQDLSEVWLDGKLDTVAFVYRGSVNIHVLEFPTPYTDPTAEYAGQIAAGGSDKAIGTVRGHIALVIQPHTDAIRANPAWVEFVEGGIVFVLSSDDGTTTQLEEVARSLT